MRLAFWRSRRPDPIVHVCGCGLGFATREERAEHMRVDCPNRPGYIPQPRRYRDVSQARRYDIDGDS